MHIQAFATVILVDDRGWLLLQERDSDAPVAPNKWAMVGGHVEPGELFEAAAYRELAEETGITWTSGLELWSEGSFQRSSGEVAHFTVWVAPTDLADADVVLGEGAQIVFVEPRAVYALDLCESAKHFVLQFLGSAEYQALREIQGLNDRAPGAVRGTVR